MALIQIQGTNRQQGPSSLEKISMGVDIATKILGTAFSIPEALQKGKLAKAQQTRERAETAATVGTKFRPLQPGEKPDVELPQEYGGQLKLRETSREMSDLDKTLLGTYAQDYRIVPQPTPKSIKLNVSGNDFFFEPKEGKVGDEAFTRESGLRKEFLDQSKEFIQQTSAYSRIVESGKDPSAAGDLALIFGYMKILDPGSTVREGEFANAQNSAGVSDRIRGIYNRVADGERLADPQRKDFLNRAARLYKGATQIHNKREDFYSDLAHEKDLDPTTVVPKLSISVVEDLKATEKPKPTDEDLFK